VTKLLEQAIAAVRDLSDSEQDEASELLFSLASHNRGPVTLDDETRTAILEGSEAGVPRGIRERCRNGRICFRPKS
jgi:hypothetical protein